MIPDSFYLATFDFLSTSCLVTGKVLELVWVHVVIPLVHRDIEGRYVPPSHVHFSFKTGSEIVNWVKDSDYLTLPHWYKIPVVAGSLPPHNVLRGVGVVGHRNCFLHPLPPLSLPHASLCPWAIIIFNFLRLQTECTVLRVGVRTQVWNQILLPLLGYDYGLSYTGVSESRLLQYGDWGLLGILNIWGLRQRKIIGNVVSNIFIITYRMLSDELFHVFIVMSRGLWQGKCDQVVTGTGSPNDCRLLALGTCAGQAEPRHSCVKVNAKCVARVMRAPLPLMLLCINIVDNRHHDTHHLDNFSKRKP